MAATSIIFHHEFWPTVVVLLSLPKAVKAIQALRATNNDITEIRQKAIKSPYPLYSIRLHALFAETAVIGLVLAAVLRLILKD